MTILAIYTIIHVLISLVAIASGFVVLGGLLGGKFCAKLTAFFLITTVATSVTGFFFPFKGFTPAYALGFISLVLLAAALYALYKRHLTGGWRKTFVITAMVSLYLNTFVLIVQLFQKVPALHALAPTQSEPPFAISQGVLLLAFIVLITLAAIRFRPAIPGEAASI